LLGRLAAETPGSTIHLVGYSSGGYVALEAAKRASPGVPISRVIVLHGTVSPAYDLSKVTARAAVLNVYGPCDVFINGLGPLLFGTNDRVHGPACGLVGFRAAVPGLTQRSWRWRDIGEGYVGDHFTVMSRNWIARHIAPQLVGEGG
jgi:pimeloyl-ACP methyl ester carboxylesterase